METSLTKPDGFTHCLFGSSQIQIIEPVDVGFHAILQVNSDRGVNVASGHANTPAAQQLKRAAEKYFNKFKRLLCFHIRRDLDMKTVSIAIHGFFSYVFGAEQLEFCKIRLQMSMMLYEKVTGELQYEYEINSEIAINKPEFTLDGGHSSCKGTEPIFGNGNELDDGSHKMHNIFYLLQNHHSEFSLAGAYKLVFLTDLPTLDPLSIAETIKDRSSNSDMIIIASDGEEFPCHKYILGVHSPVLATMIQSGLEESESGQIKMEDMSSEGVKAFLDFLYERKVNQAMERSNIALELFQAGHKYNIDILESTIKSIMLVKANAWFDINVALEVFILARNIEGCEDLKRKVVQVIKSKSKDASESTSFQDLFKKDPLIALDLFSCT